MLFFSPKRKLSFPPAVTSNERRYRVCICLTEPIADMYLRYVGLSYQTGLWLTQLGEGFFVYCSLSGVEIAWIAHFGYVCYWGNKLHPLPTFTKNEALGEAPGTELKIWVPGLLRSAGLRCPGAILSTSFRTQCGSRWAGLISSTTWLSSLLPQRRHRLRLMRWKARGDPEIPQIMQAALSPSAINVSVFLKTFSLDLKASRVKDPGTSWVCAPRVHQPHWSVVVLCSLFDIFWFWFPATGSHSAYLCWYLGICLPGRIYTSVRWFEGILHPSIPCPAYYQPHRKLSMFNVLHSLRSTFSGPLCLPVKSWGIAEERISVGEYGL